MNEHRHDARAAQPFHGADRLLAGLRADDDDERTRHEIRLPIGEARGKAADRRPPERGRDD